MDDDIYEAENINTNHLQIDIKNLYCVYFFLCSQTKNCWKLINKKSSKVEGIIADFCWLKVVINSTNSFCLWERINSEAIGATQA